MTTPLIPSPAPTASQGAPAPTGAANIPSITPTAPAFASAAATTTLPSLSPGHQSSEFYLALIVVTAIMSALWAGKLDPALASALLGLIVSGYPSLRTWLKAQHVDAMADVLAAQGGQAGVALGALSGALNAANGSSTTQDIPAPGPQSSPRDTGGSPSATTLGVLCVLGAMLLGLSGCAETPYYVSGINGTVDTSKDGSRISGGVLGVTISPNPYYPSAGSARSLPNTKGYTK
jgi:hypothetical protein